MYTSERLRSRLAAGEILLGLAHHYPSAAVVESMARGWDFIWIDAQHGQHTYESALTSARVAQALGMDTLLRVDSRDPDLLGKYADTGTNAVMIPMVNGPQEAAAIVRALRYPPMGQRSYASRRVVDLVGADYHLKAPPPVIVAQIETAEAVKEMKAIAEVDGVDLLFFGPDDLRLRMGVPYDQPVEQAPALLDAMRQTADAARSAGKFAACPAHSPALASLAIDMGYQMLVGGGDAGFVRVGAADRLKLLKPLVCKRDSRSSA